MLGRRRAEEQGLASYVLCNCWAVKHTMTAPPSVIPGLPSAHPHPLPNPATPHPSHLLTPHASAMLMIFQTHSLPFHTLVHLETCLIQMDIYCSYVEHGLKSTLSNKKIKFMKMQQYSQILHLDFWIWFFI